MSSHDEKSHVAKLKSTLAVEKERLKYVNKKLVEKTDYHDRSVAELQRAKAVRIAAHQDDGNLEQAAGRKAFVRMCESLESSWGQNVDIAKQQLNQWEFKS